MSQNYPLSLCLITRNEQRFLQRCLESVTGLVSEIIVCDTGSSDSTVEIAQKFSAKIFNLPWENDFAAARNFSLRKASQPWLLVLDADEALDPKGLAEIKTVTVQKPQAYYLVRRHYSNQASGILPASAALRTAWGDQYFSFSETHDLRLFPNDPSIEYAGRIHEGIELSVWNQKIPTVHTQVLIHHFGQLKSTEERDSKSKLYLELTRLKWTESKGDWKAAIEYSEVLCAHDRAKEALHVLEQAETLDPPHAEFWFFKGQAQAACEQYEASIHSFERAVRENSTYHPAYAALGQTLFKLGLFESASTVFEQAVVLTPHDQRAWLRCALAAEASGNSEKAQQFYRQAQSCQFTTNP